MAETADKVTSQADDLCSTRESVSSTWTRTPYSSPELASRSVPPSPLLSLDSGRRDLFGETSDALRRQAEGVAAKGVDVAKAAFEGAAAAAGEQGLSPEGLATLGESLTEKVRAVADRGVEAALGKANPPGTT